MALLRAMALSISRTCRRAYAGPVWGASRVRAASTSRSTGRSTLVVGEHEPERGGSLSAATLSAVSAASYLGGDTNSVSLLLGGGGPSVQEAARRAAETVPAICEVWAVEWEAMDHGLAEPWAEAVVAAQMRREFSHVVAPASSFGKNVLPRAAGLVGKAVVSDVVKMLDGRTFVRPVYAGNALSTVRYRGTDPCFLTVRATAFPAAAASRREGGSAPIRVLEHAEMGSSEAIGRSEWVGQEKQQSERPQLGTARVVVSGGRALKTADNFALLERLADRLGGAVGASRAAVDGGMVPNDMQVGQTGKIVAPDLYFAVGISGAIQHLAGMKDSKVIVAVNKDADAPIFQVADYGLVGDLFQIVPELLEKLPSTASSS